jgi:hypothetical protein
MSMNIDTSFWEIPVNAQEAALTGYSQQAISELIYFQPVGSVEYLGAKPSPETPEEVAALDQGDAYIAEFTAQTDDLLAKYEQALWELQQNADDLWMEGEAEADVVAGLPGVISADYASLLFDEYGQPDSSGVAAVPAALVIEVLLFLLGLFLPDGMDLLSKDEQLGNWDVRGGDKFAMYRFGRLLGIVGNDFMSNVARTKSDGLSFVRAEKKGGDRVTTRVRNAPPNAPWSDDYEDYERF